MSIYSDEKISFSYILSRKYKVNLYRYKYLPTQDALQGASRLTGIFIPEARSSSVLAVREALQRMYDQ